MAERFRVISAKEAREQGLPDVSKWAEDYEGYLYDFGTDPPILVASDYMEPEDASFYRSLAWIPKLLNELENKREL